MYGLSTDSTSQGCVLAYETDVPVRIDVRYYQEDLFDFFLKDIMSKGPLMILTASDVIFICYDHVSVLINDSDEFNEQLYGMPKYIMEGVRNSCDPLALLPPMQKTPIS